MPTSEATAAPNERTSSPYAAGRPATAITMPPMAGPMTAAVWKLSWFRAIAAGSRSAGTRRGTAEDRAGWSTAPRLAATNATA